VTRFATLVRAGLVAAIACLAAHPVSAETIEKMAGQMILTGFQGDSVDDESVVALAEDIRNGLVGGVMYLKPNIKDFESVTAINRLFMSANPDLPPFISVDQEGGAVQRLTPAVGFPDTPSAADLAKSYGTEFSPLSQEDGPHRIYETMARSLSEWGFNVNFGPVVDVNINKENPIIAKYGRSYSDNVLVIMQYAFAFIEAHHKFGVLTALKHFPGHGSSTGDTHEGFVDITKTWEEAEFTSYKMIISLPKDSEARADFVMVGHLYNAQHSGPEDRLPASLSPFWITEELRGKLKFDGVVITDDLEMAAVRKLFPLGERVRQAVRAGVDVLLFSNTAKPRTTLAAEVQKILVDEANKDPAFAARIKESYDRIVEVKKRLHP
jgi:beta-N-acetylhexosaminidase